MLGPAPRSVSLALPVLGVLALALATAASAASRPTTGAQIAGILSDTTVYADPAARPTLTPGQVARVRLRILERAPSRLAIAVVSNEVARTAGGVRGLARAIDQRFDVTGALLVIDSDTNSAWVVVSYADTERAIRAVRSAYAGRASFVAHTLEAVDRLAAADPGPGGAGTGSLPGPVSTPPDISTDVDTGLNAAPIVLGILAIPFLIVVLRITRRGRAARRNQASSGGFMVTPPTPGGVDAQRQAAEKAFGGNDS